MEKLLEALVSKTLNIDSSKFAELVKTEDGELKKDALKILLEQDATRVQNLKLADETELKTRFDNGYAKAKSETLKELEKEIKTTFEFTSDKKGVELINEIVAAKSKVDKTVEITPEKIKQSKIYLDMMDIKEAEKSKAVEDVTSQFQGKIEQFEKQGTLSVVNKKASKIIDALNPILSKDLTKASNQKNTIFEKLGKYNFKVEDDRIILLNEKNELLEDEHRNPVKFENVVKDVTCSLFDLAESKERKSGGGTEDEDGKGDEKFEWNGVAPKTQKEYQLMINNAKTLDEKKAIMKSWNDSRAD